MRIGVERPLSFEDNILIEMIYATAANHIIGCEGQLPWGYIKSDMDWFKEKTNGKVIVMGRRTWESIGKKLPNRINVVLSSHEIEGPDLVLYEEEIKNIIPQIQAKYPDKDIIFIGGRTIYVQAIFLCDRIHITTIQAEAEGDTVFDCRQMCLLAYRRIYERTVPETHVSPGLVFETFEKIVN